MGDKIRYAKYEVGTCNAADLVVLKDGHTMFSHDIVKDLNRKSFLEALKHSYEEQIDIIVAKVEALEAENKRLRAAIEDLVIALDMSQAFIRKGVLDKDIVLDNIDEVIIKLDVKMEKLKHEPICM